MFLQSGEINQLPGLTDESDPAVGSENTEQEFDEPLTGGSFNHKFATPNNITTPVQPGTATDLPDLRKLRHHQTEPENLSNGSELEEPIMNMESLEQEYWCNQLDDLTSSKLQPNVEEGEDAEDEDQEEPEGQVLDEYPDVHVQLHRAEYRSDEEEPENFSFRESSKLESQK